MHSKVLEGGNPQFNLNYVLLDNIKVHILFKKSEKKTVIT